MNSLYIFNRCEYFHTVVSISFLGTNFRIFNAYHVPLIVYVNLYTMISIVINEITLCLKVNLSTQIFVYNALKQN